MMVGVRGMTGEECDTGGGAVTGVSSTVRLVVREVGDSVVSVCTSAGCISDVLTSTIGVRACSYST